MLGKRELNLRLQGVCVLGVHVYGGGRARWKEDLKTEKGLSYSVLLGGKTKKGGGERKHDPSSSRPVGLHCCAK